jgi:hypothetical protein
MRKRGVDKDLIFLLVSTLIVVATWIGLEVYRAYIKVNIPTGVEKYMSVIDTSLRTNVLDVLERRSP